MSFIEGQFVYMMMMEGDASRLKIGYSNNPIRRSKELYSTGVPFPYHVLHAWSVRDMIAAEKIVHNALRDYRINPNREIFEVYEKFPDSIDYNLPDVINGLNIANELAYFINQLFDSLGVEYGRWYPNDLETYHRNMEAHQRNLRKGYLKSN
ncbi:GIY-YIG nuclease family protein [Massilia sp. X63]|uniref:GIY-YIG nuclease family protein n=1 Tax=Massilia sp. X63 TaxID=3237285 RepID=UPI0034DD5E41